MKPVLLALLLAATPDCPGEVRIRNGLPTAVDVEVVGAAGPASGRFRRVPGGQTAEIAVRKDADVSVTARGRLAPEGSSGAGIQGVRIENTRTSKADVAILGADGRATAALAGAILGGAAERRGSNEAAAGMLGAAIRASRRRQRETLKETLRMEVPNVLIGEGASGRSELNRAMGLVETWLRRIRFHEMLARRNHLEGNTEDPCSACGEPQGGTGPTEGERAAEARRADCERLLRMLRDAELELNSNRASKAEYDQRLADAERGKRELAARCENDLRAAQREMDDARTAWRRASQRISDLLQIGDRPSSPSVREAEAREREAKTRRDAASDRLDALRRECDEGQRGFEGEIGICRSNLSRLNDAIPPLERRGEETRRNLESCERGR